MPVNPVPPTPDSSDRLLAALRQHFGLPAFRPGQREVIEAALAKKDAMCIMPTGSGKSLCYQLPGMMLDGVTLAEFREGRLVGTVRLWNVRAGRGRPALLLGPLAVHPDYRSRGVGAALMRRALGEAARLGHAAVLLVGDAAYYGRFGFIAEKTQMLRLAGADPARLLGLELLPGALTGAHGAIFASGECESVLPSLARRVRPRARLIPHAA